MTHVLEILGLWSALAVPSSFAAGYFIHKAKGVSLSENRAITSAPANSNRTAQHQYDALHNPGYRGGYKA
jgi:hypothetical protein